MPKSIPHSGTKNTIFATLTPESLYKLWDITYNILLVNVCLVFVFDFDYFFLFFVYLRLTR